MKQNTYRVYFVNRFSNTVVAFTEVQAIILAQAIQIKAGRDHTVSEVKKIPVTQFNRLTEKDGPDPSAIRYYSKE